MAYGSAKGRIFRGDIYAEDDPNQDTYIDWGNDFISFGVGGVKVLNVSASNTLVQVLGNVSASLNMTASGHVSASAFYGDGQYLKNVGGGAGGGIFTTLGSGNAYTTSSIRVGSVGEPSASLYVSGTGAGAGPVFRLDSSVAGGTPLFFVSGSGRVGIGTATPGIGGSSDTKLDVQGHLTIGKSGTAYIFNNNDADTYIKLGGSIPPGTDGMQFFVGGKRMLMLDENGTDRVVIGNSSSDFTVVSGSLIVSGAAYLSSSGYDGKDLFLGNGTSRQIGARFAGDDYLAIQNTNGRILLSSSAGHEIVGGGSDGLGLFGVSGVYLYGDEDGNKLSGSILKSGIISGSRVTVAGNVSCSNVWVRPGNSVIFDAANTYKITNNGTNLDINGDNIILNANTKVSASAPLTASGFYGSRAQLSSSNPDGKELLFGNGTSRKIGTSFDGADDYLVMANTAGGIDVSASEGVTLIAGNNTNVTAYGAGNYKFQLADATFATVFYADNNGNVSASSNITASGHVSASAFYGDGQYLKNIGGPATASVFTVVAAKEAFTTSSLRIGGVGKPSSSVYISGSADGAMFRIDTPGITNGSIFFVTSSGQVGIGSSERTGKTSVSGSKTTLTINNSANISYPTLGKTAFAGLHFEPSTATNAYSMGVTFGVPLDAYANTTQAGMWSLADSAKGSNLTFGTTNSWAAGAKARMTISHLGAVGINTLSPTTGLDVHYTGSIDPTALSNDTGGGEVVYFGTSSVSGLQAGALYYLNAKGGWASASAAQTGSSPTSGGGQSQLLAISLGSNPSSDGMLTRGFVDAETYFVGAYKTGSAVYVSTASAKFKSVAPTASNNYVRVIGYATTTPKVIYFNPGSTYVEIA
jgi:hypothetical protein